MLKRALSLCVLGSVLALAACSGSDSGSPQGVGTVPDAFSKYCTGTLKTDQKLMKPMDGGGWIGDGSLHAGAGTTFFVSPDFNHWQGYVVQSDGSVDKVDADFDKGLVKDTDFTSDCAVDAALNDFTKQQTVVLTPSKVYANKDLSGDACVMDPGTAMTSFMYMSGGFGGPSSAPASVGSDQIKTKCGYASGYSNDFEYASLIPKQ